MEFINMLSLINPLVLPVVTSQVFTQLVSKISSLNQNSFVPFLKLASNTLLKVSILSKKFPKTLHHSFAHQNQEKTPHSWFLRSSLEFSFQFMRAFKDVHGVLFSTTSNFFFHLSPSNSNLFSQSK